MEWGGVGSGDLKPSSGSCAVLNRPLNVADILSSFENRGSSFLHPRLQED